MSGPVAAIGTGPGGSAAAGIDQMELTPIPLGVIAQQAGFHLLGAAVLLEPLQPADAEIGVGVGLGGHGPHARADVRHGGAHR